MQGLLQAHRPHGLSTVGVLTEVHRESEAIATRRIRQRQSVDRARDVGGVTFLQAEHIGFVALGERRELGCRTMLAQVVRDDLHTATQDRRGTLPAGDVGLAIAGFFDNSQVDARSQARAPGAPAIGAKLLTLAND